jgi:DNA repair exonuclease SbcCD ATPase subunit
VSQNRATDLERQLSEMDEKRGKTMSSATLSGRSLRDSEDRFLREERLRDELDFSRRQKLELEAALLDRDSKALEMKFDLEASESEIQRLKRRLKEIEQAYRSMQNVVNAGGGVRAQDIVLGTSNTSTMLGSNTKNASKRELELEGVIDAMKRVVDKLRNENDRLKRLTPSDQGGGTSGTATNKTESDKRYQAEKKRADKLEEELKSAQEKIRNNEDTSQKVALKQQQIASLRKQLKGKDDDISSLREEIDRSVSEKDQLKRRTKTLEERVQALEIALQQANNSQTSGNNAELENMRRRLSSQQAESDVMKSECEELRRKVRELSQLSTANTSNSNPEELRRLKEENEKLKQELSSFDLDFFEEIENLKYAHAEALRKLRMYEARR